MELSSFYNSITEFWKQMKGYTRPWNFSVSTVNTSQTYSYTVGATGFLFTNTGAVAVSVNGKILFPGTVGSVLGDAFAVAAHKDDVFKGQIKVQFTAGAGPALEILEVFYMDVKQR